MLPARHRMRRGEDFTHAVRRGRRSGSTHLVAHLLLPPAMTVVREMEDADGSTRVLPVLRPALVGLVVSRAVGIAVVRTRVKRRLRALMASRLHQLPDGSLLVLRANPAAAHATSSELAGSLDRAMSRLLPGRPVRA